MSTSRPQMSLSLVCLLAGLAMFFSFHSAWGDTWLNIEARYVYSNGLPPPTPAQDFDFWLVPTYEANHTSGDFAEYDDLGVESVAVGGGTVDARHHHYYGTPINGGDTAQGCLRFSQSVNGGTVLKAWWTDVNGARIPNTVAAGLHVEVVQEKGDLTLFITNMSGFVMDVRRIRYGDAVTEPTLELLNPQTYVPPEGWLSAGEILGLASSGYSQEDWQVGYGGSGWTVLTGASDYPYLVVIFDIEYTDGTHVATYIMAFDRTAAPVPTVTEWGLIALTGSLGIVGIILVMRRRSAAFVT